MIFLPPDRTANLIIWAVVWAVVLVWIAVTTVMPRLPSLADVVESALRSWVLRWALFAFWVWLGWHLLVRTTL